MLCGTWSLASLVAVAHLAFNIAGVRSSVTFLTVPPGSPLFALDLYATPLTSFVGPQPGVVNSARSGPIVLFDGDMCKPMVMRAPGCVLLATTAAASGAGCSFEDRYLTLYATGASAVILPFVDGIPSYDLYSNDGSKGAHTRDLPMLFVQIGPSIALYNALITNGPGQNATVSPDVNVWQATYASWRYQIFIRILPSAIMIASGVTAAVFFAFHMRILDRQYRSAVPVSRRSLSRWATHTSGSFTRAHTVLVVEMITATVSGIALAIGGFHSTPYLSYPVGEFFLSLLGGWGSASSLLSASVWVRHAKQIVDSKSLLNRILRGDYPITFAALLVIPVAMDTAISIVFAIYYDMALLSKLASGIMFLVQLTVSLHVLAGVLRYYWIVRNVQEQTAQAAGRSTGTDQILGRLSRCALGMSLSTIMVCSGTALMAASPVFLLTTSGRTVSFSLAYIGRSLDSAFRVAMFKPRFTLLPSTTLSVVATVTKSQKSHNAGTAAVLRLE
ncbi:hypothetical protein PBRA_005774 [Plasmodiophora brassicae]|uniref:Uncharacterized protein n=1 Tax=Plasmodiophora brassicae TaxID=37360 RepID=A0A0G4IPM8_PLABS|nr:hypothetical protein PBRA_005774 [Plasmodiophora brassicae]